VRRTSGLLLVLIVVVSWAPAASEPWGTLDERERVFQAVVDVFERNYWDEGYRDWQEWAEPFREEALSARSREEFDRVVDRMVARLGDDHSAWIGLVSRAGDEAAPSEPARLGIRGSLLPGTGLVVERVFPGTAAASAGVRRGDVIVGIDDHDVNGPGHGSDVWRELREASGRNSMTLQVQRGRSRMGIALEPAPFDIHAAQQKPHAEMLDGAMGYLYLPSFNGPEISAEVHRLLRQLQADGLKQLVLDLRGNPGGRLSELGLTLGAFLQGSWARAVSRGQVVWEGRYELEGRRGITWLEDSMGRILLRHQLALPARFEGPMAVLVDRQNSSAGELAALVLQSSGRAIVIGEPTQGNVEAVRSFDLPDGSVVMVAIANVESVDGRSFSEGVRPDLLAHESLAELAQGYDAPLSAAIRHLRGLPFTPNRFFGLAAAD
jgi:carboxyl-terminal processing protease